VAGRAAPAQRARRSLPRAAAAAGQSSRPETKRSGQGPLLRAAPGKSRGIVAPREPEGQPRRGGARGRTGPSAPGAPIAAALALLAAPALQEPADPFGSGPARAQAIARAWVFARPQEAVAATLDSLVAGADDDAALELVRRVPLPEEPGRVASLVEELGRGALHDQLVLERIAAAPPPARDAALRAASRQAREGRFAPSFAAAVAFLRGATERAGGAADLFEDSLRPELDVAAYARLAFDRVVAREVARGRGAAVADLELALAASHPGRPELLVAAATALLAAGELDRAETAFAAAVAADDRARSTAALERRGCAELGRAWIALLRGAAAETAAALERAVHWPRPLLPHEDPLRVVELRAALVAAVAGELTGRPAPAALAEAIASAPVDVQRCFVDEAWFGTLGPAALLGTLREAGQREALLRAALGLCEAIEATHGLHGHGLLSTAAEDDLADRERLASWLFVGAAERILSDRGDPEGALAFLAPRLERLERRQRPANQELAVEAKLLAARCAMRAGDAASARRAADGALEVARALSGSAGREYVRRVVHEESPVPPASRLLFRSDPPYSALVARALALRAGLRATLAGDVDGAAADLFEAGAAWPWDEARWLTCALDLARRGRGPDARRCLALVEAAPEHAYDRACVLAQLGERETALALSMSMDTYTDLDVRRIEQDATGTVTCSYALVPRHVGRGGLVIAGLSIEPRLLVVTIPRTDAPVQFVRVP